MAARTLSTKEIALRTAPSKYAHLPTKLAGKTRQAERRVLLRKNKKIREETKRQNFEDRRRYQTKVSDQSKNFWVQRRAWEEDWKLGALAPNRVEAAGIKREEYGAMPPTLWHPPAKTSKEDVWWLKKGDRVVVTEGREKGKIGTVENVGDEAGATVTVGGLNQTYFQVPGYMVKAHNSPAAMLVPRGIPISSVRLVVRMGTPENPHVKKDVIVSEVDKRFYTNQERHTLGKSRKDFKRMVKGLEIEIPWPEEEEKEYADYDSDTLRIKSEEITWMPNLLAPPMPASIIDELRNKYSKFRTRHDPAYLEELREKERAEEERRGVMMTSPILELAKKRRKERERAAAKRELSQDQLVKLGQLVAESREKAKASQMRGFSPSEASSDASSEGAKVDATA